MDLFLICFPYVPLHRIHWLDWKLSFPTVLRALLSQWQPWKTKLRSLSPHVLHPIVGVVLTADALLPVLIEEAARTVWSSDPKWILKYRQWLKSPFDFWTEQMWFWSHLGRTEIHFSDIGFDFKEFCDYVYTDSTFFIWGSSTVSFYPKCLFYHASRVGNTAAGIVCFPSSVPTVNYNRLFWQSVNSKTNWDGAGNTIFWTPLCYLKKHFYSSFL